MRRWARSCATCRPTSPGSSRSWRATTRTSSAEILTRGRQRHARDPGQARRPRAGDRFGVRLGARPPGELARLFADVGEIGVNIEDLYIDHDPGRPVGLVELVVRGHSRRVAAALLSSTREWLTHR